MILNSFYPDGCKIVGIFIFMISLFVITFLSATLLPLSSEVVVLAYLSGGANPFDVWIIASLGNILGGATNYGLGRLFGHLPFVLEQVSHPRMHKWVPRIQRRGAVLGILGFVPIIGDPLLLCMGLIQTPWLPTLSWMSIGKILRYGALVIPFH